MKKNRSTYTTKLLCINALITFSLAIVNDINANNNIEPLPIILVFFLGCIYICCEYITEKLHGKIVYILFTLQCSIVIASCFIIPNGAWILLLNFGAILFIYALSIFNNNVKGVFISYILIYLIMYLLFNYTMNINVQYTIIKSITLSLLLIILFTNIKRMFNNNVKRYLKKVNELNERKLISSKILEREKIARSIHDTIAQGIVSIIMYLDILEKKLNDNNIEKIKSLYKTIEDQMNQVLIDSVAEIKSLILEKKEINKKIKIDDFKKNIEEILSETKIIMNYEGDYRDLFIFEEEKIDNLVYIIYEFLRNSRIHSKCNKINMSFTRSKKSLRIIISDNGIGYDTNLIKKNRYGIIGIKERAKYVGAQLKITSELKKGTIIDIDMPIDL